MSDELDEELDALDAALSDAAKAKLKAAEEAAGISDEGPLSSAAITEMKPDLFDALIDESQGIPRKRPESFDTDKKYLEWLETVGVSRG
jgi:hypothetical protein